jgi:predicted GNAT family acetyltransferase
MLALGRGWGVRARGVDGAGPLVASTVVLPYDGGFAWISMVLVLPAFRGQGLATRLVRHALAYLAERGLTPILDATPAGHAVYARQGFVDTWGFARYRRAAAVPAPPAACPKGWRLRPWRDADAQVVAAYDRPVFGASRQALLRALSQRRPLSAWLAEDETGRLRGMVCARDGRDADQVGPLVADDPIVGLALLDAALAPLRGAVYVDLCNRHRILLPRLQALGFEFQRPFTRMMLRLHGQPTQAPGDPSRLLLAAGPELG